MFRAGIPESGILRKHKVLKENLDDLLVFGYACKLFRDNEKAIYIDQGKHLIPWMCDETLRIDRYDGRGTLSDLKSCEASREGYDTTRWLGLNESERKVEQLCDEERYYSLTSNEEEELLYKEEELKRQKANEFQYNYEDSPKIEDDSSSQTSYPTVEQDDRPYIPRPELDVPADISTPKTIKENARIEKTAMFVSQQGLQMEILIKAKQANNSQFSFMNQADSLYKYYRHVVAAFKSGRYTMTKYGDNGQDASITAQQDPSGSATDEQLQQTSGDQQYYLHPSLGNQQSPQPLPPPSDSTQQLAGPAAIPLAPTLTYRPRADCAYTQLITRIKGAQQLHKEQQEGGAAGDKIEPTDTSLPAASAGGALTVDQQQQYFQYYYTMRYYDGYKQLGEQYTAQGLDPQLLLRNTSIQDQIQQQASQYAQGALTAYMAQFAATATAVEAQTAQASPLTNQGQQIAVVQTTSVATAAQAPVIQSTEVTSKAVNPLLGLAHYGSDSEEEDEEDCAQNRHKKDGKMDEKEIPSEAAIPLKSEANVVPPEDISVIIDKMAAYVAKNGVDFENIVRSRGDSRFEFLTPKHEYNSYYKRKLNECLGTTNVNSQETDKGTSKRNNNNASADSKQNGNSTINNETIIEKKLPIPVSFSIKAREESQIEIKPSALPMEESSDEEEEEEQISKNQQLQQEATKISLNDIETQQSCLRNSLKNNSTSSIRSNSTAKDVAILSVKTNSIDGRCNNNLVESKREKEDVLVVATEVRKFRKEEEKKSGEGDEDDDTLLEMIDLTDDLDEKNDDCAKSKSYDQQRALQLERKRKAAAFLRLRSMMDVLYTKPTESHIDRKDAANNDLPTRKLSGVGSRESRGKEEVAKVEVGQVRARRESTQSRSSDVVEIIDDSDEEEVKEKAKKGSKKKKSHKRKRSKSSRTPRDGSSSSSSRRKSKKHRKRSHSNSRSKNRTKASRSRSRTPSSSRSS